MIIRKASRTVLWLTGSGLALTLAIASQAQAQDASSGLVDDPEELREAPAGVTGTRIAPLTSRFSLNGTVLEYGTAGFVDVGAFDGNRRNTVPLLDFSYALSSDIEEGIELDNEGALYWRNHTGWYGQLRSVTRKNTITSTREEAGDLTGFRVRLSVTGTCLPNATDYGFDQLCTYTPGLTFDEDSLDPDLLIPTEGVTDSVFGQVISQETYEALQQPGWQRGVQGGDEFVGLDIDVPNAGFLGDESRASFNGVRRHEQTRTRLMFSLSRVEQNLYSNAERASVDNTVRSFVLLDRDEWTGEAIAAQLAAWVLPSVDARLPLASGQPGLNVSNNLFHSANNVRLPGDSFTVFHTGAGYVDHPVEQIRSVEDTPAAWYNSFWMGFSPVRDITRTGRLSYTPTGDRQWIVGEGGFAEGGYGGDVDLSGIGNIIGGITIIDELDGILADIDFSDFENLDLWVQLGTDASTQEVIQRIISRETSDYRYVPHLSFSGNRTDGTSVLRYYTGVIVDDDANAYIGADYTLNTTTGWSLYARADLYSDPDRDYYSEAEGRLSKSFDLGPDRGLTFGVAGVVELDRPGNGGAPRLGEADNQLDLIGQYRHSDLSFVLRQRFNNLTNENESSSTTVGLNWRVTPRLALSGQVTPISDEGSYVKARAGLTWRLAEDLSAPALRMQWARINYDHGRDSLGNRLESEEDTFLAALQFRF